MTILSPIRRFLALGVVVGSLSLIGCSSGGSTPDTAPTAPPITEDNAKDMAKDINAGVGAGGMKSPGVTPKR